MYIIEELITKVDKLVKLSIFNTAHPCLYYSYSRCRVLRKFGYFVQLNIGLHNLHPGQNAEGHCWLSRKGEVLFEDQDPNELYPDKIGEQDDVVYWGRLKNSTGMNIRRVKKT